MNCTLKPMARVVAGCVATLALAACGNDTVSEEYTQPEFGATTYTQLKVDGYTYLQGHEPQRQDRSV